MLNTSISVAWVQQLTSPGIFSTNRLNAHTVALTRCSHLFSGYCTSDYATRIYELNPLGIVIVPSQLPLNICRMRICSSNRFIGLQNYDQWQTILHKYAGALSVKLTKYEFYIFGLPQQLPKLNNPTIHLPNNDILSHVDSARNLGVIFDKNL